jgi:hypothetical protein
MIAGRDRLGGEIDDPGILVDVEGDDLASIGSGGLIVRAAPVLLRGSGQVERQDSDHAGSKDAEDVPENVDVAEAVDAAEQETTYMVLVNSTAFGDAADAKASPCRFRCR